MTANPALEQFIRSLPLFSLVDPPEMMDILRLLRPVKLEPGQVLFRQGTPGEAMWVLGDTAEVSISTAPKDGARPVVIAYAKAGQTVGEMALIEEGPRSATAVVTQGGSAHEIAAMDFQALRDSKKPAAYKVLRQLAVELCAKLRATSDRVAPSNPKPVPTPPLEEGRPATQADLDQFPAFKSLPQVVKLAMAQKLRLVETNDLQPLFSEGEAADAAYFLLEGEVTVGRGGKTLSTLGPGSMFGIVAAIDGGTRSASVLATGHTRMLRLSDADFDALFASGNRFAYGLVDQVARQLVQHIRSTNMMVRAPGYQAGTRSASVPTPGAKAASGSSPLDEISMELELELPEAFGEDFAQFEG